VFSTVAIAQTVNYYHKGYIYTSDPAFIGNNKQWTPPTVLDPNGDKSITDQSNNVVNGGNTYYYFTSPIAHEVTEFEIPYIPTWQYAREPTADLETGSTCGQSEIVDKTSGDYQAAYYYIDKTTPGGPYLLFRLRVAQDATGAFGFSFFLDTDLKFGNSGPDADPNAVSGNPGFEYEIIYATGGGSAGLNVRWVDGVSASNQQTTLKAYASELRDMRSFAVNSNCAADDPAFYDFYINLSDLNITAGSKPANAPVITGSTPFRLAVATASSPGSGLGGSASDIGGIDDQANGTDDNRFTIVITNQPPQNFEGGVITCTPGTDTDGDLVDDCDDLDDDNDGILDTDEGGDVADADGDGIPNRLDLDSDNDGIADVVEAGGSDPDNNGIIGTGASSAIAVNSDGIPTGANGGAGLTATNSDTDVIPDFLDIDSDNDGIVDVIESQYTADYTAPTGTDTDGDGIDDAFDPDQGGSFTGTLADTDDDGTPDVRDLDSDGDGSSDEVEANQGTYAAADADGDGLADVFDNYDNASPPVTPTGTNADNNGQTPTSPFPNDYSAIGRPESNWRDLYALFYDCTAAAWKDNTGTVVDVTLPAYDDYMLIAPDCGGTPVVVTQPVRKRTIVVPPGGEINFTSCVEVIDFVINHGIFRLKATTDASYGQYLGPAVDNVEFEMIMNENGWHNIAFPVSITARNFALQNNTATDPKLVNLTGDAEHNLWWYNSAISGGKEQGFYIDRNGVQYSTHVYGKWSMIGDGIWNSPGIDEELSTRTCNYFISGNYFNTTRILKAKGRSHDEAVSFSTSDNFGGFNLIPNVYPITISTVSMYNDGFFHAGNNLGNPLNFDAVIWIWNPADPNVLPVPGQFNTGSYVAFDPQTGNALNAAVDGSDAKIAPFQSFYVRRVTAHTARRMDVDGTDFNADAVAVPIDATVDPYPLSKVDGTTPIPGQATVTGTDIPVTLKPSYRALCTSTQHYKTDFDVLMLRVSQSNDMERKDFTEIVCHSQFQEGLDVGYDIAKMGVRPGSPAIFTFVEDKPMVINKMSYPEDKRSIKVGFVSEVEENYTIDLTETPAGWRIYLEDVLAGAWHDLSAAPYTFKNDSQARVDRFKLHFSMKSEAFEPIRTEFIAWGTDAGIIVKNINFASNKVDIMVTNIVGQVVYEAKQVDLGDQYVISMSAFDKSMPAMYIISINADEEQQAIKIVR